MSAAVIERNQTIATEEHYPSGAIRRITRKNEQGQFHAEDAPAVETYYQNGQVMLQRWIVNGRFHREGGAPSISSYDVQGNLVSARWHQDGILMRIWNADDEAMAA